ncbi:Helix-turn-helix domain protein [Rosistilla carotiformis]|uniref:Helix-turn-helix domain protein n=2 Tax=Rosistilla carotiformis TaxID=2528017 RepID=A0A518JTD7_9BACT|nr:Helix-turn-helix domain protein [Rosistilla carotiformis]
MRVSESSVKRWCDRGIIPSVKTGGGHRRISVESLAQFLRETKRTLLAPEKLGVAPLDVVPSSAVRRVDVESNVSNAGCEAIVETFTNALLDGDEAACRQIIQQAFLRNKSFTDVAASIVCASMRRIGEIWENGHADVLQERYGCEICFRLVNELAQYIPLPGAEAPLAIGCAPPGDQYQLPTHLVELVLREAGWNARSLGNNMALDRLLEVVVRHRPQLVWVSISTIEDRAAFVGAFNAFANQLPKGVFLVAGGRAMDDEMRPLLHYTAHCDNFHQLAGLAATMLSRGR